jgi:peptidoglycan/LPS O-acetylase OafA/YrhL
MTDSRRLTGHLPTLDGWRGVAVLMVIVFHAVGGQVSALRPLGGLGVSIFFALSGLLICNRLLVEHGRTGQIDLRGFYVRRAFRILPPALVFLAVLAVVSAYVAPAATPAELFSCLFFWRNYYTGSGWYTGHFWSLAVEEHFYLFFPVLLACAGPRRTLPLAVALAAALLGWRVLDMHWPWLFERTNAVPQYYRTDCRLPDLLLGAVTALLAARVPRWLLWPAAAAGGLALLGRLANLSVPWVAQSMFLPWLLLGTVLRPDGWLGRALEWAPLAWLGRMSYSLYLWQQVFFHGPARFRLDALAPLQDWPWNAVGLLVCAVVSHYLLERPLTRLGRVLAERRPTEPPAEPQVEARRVVLGGRRWVERPALPAERPAAAAKPR